MAMLHASRPYMPDYGIQGPDEGSGLLPWSWAEERLRDATNCWVSTVWPDGRPHAMPVWTIWDGEQLWFSSGGRSRKVRNLRDNPYVIVTTEDTMNPVVVEGVAEIVTEQRSLQRFIDLMNAKYDTDYSVDFLDPAVNATVRVQPRWVFGLDQNDFSGSPTCWKFD